MIAHGLEYKNRIVLVYTRQLDFCSGYVKILNNQWYFLKQQIYYVL